MSDESVFQVIVIILLVLTFASVQRTAKVVGKIQSDVADLRARIH